jgi:hypothetical protein
MQSTLSQFTICELMGLTELPQWQQIRCGQKLEALTVELFLLDELALGLPEDEMERLMSSLSEEPDGSGLSGSIYMMELPVLEKRMQRRLEKFVTWMIRAQLKYLLSLYPEDDFARGLLWSLPAPLSQKDWKSVAMTLSFLAGKDRVPQKEEVFDQCFAAALERYRQEE